MRNSASCVSISLGFGSVSGIVHSTYCMLFMFYSHLESLTTVNWHMPCACQYYTTRGNPHICYYKSLHRIQKSAFTVDTHCGGVLQLDLVMQEQIPVDFAGNFAVYSEICKKTSCELFMLRSVSLWIECDQVWVVYFVIAIA